FFFFQAEDGIRDFHVTGVQTCALPISVRAGDGRRRGARTLGGGRNLRRGQAAGAGLGQGGAHGPQVGGGGLKLVVLGQGLDDQADRKSVVEGKRVVIENRENGSKI